MMDRVEAFIRSFIPDSKREAVGMIVPSVALAYVVYSIFLQPVPSVVIYDEKPYSTEVAQGGYLTWKVDVSFSRTCTVNARRIITASDGIEYLAAEDVKEVSAGERVQYDVRVPVSNSLPLGPARIRSAIDYQCDFWTRYIRPISARGRDRAFTILPPENPVKPAAFSCVLPERPGYRAIKAHYRKDGAVGE